MKIYEVWDAHDAATSDHFFATKAEAMECIRGSYGGRGPGEPDDILTDCLKWEYGDDQVVYLQTHSIRPTREGIAEALTNLPNR